MTLATITALGRRRAACGAAVSKTLRSTPNLPITILRTYATEVHRDRATAETDVSERPTFDGRASHCQATPCSIKPIRLLEIWDFDDTSHNDHLGTVSQHYSIDDLWGGLVGQYHEDGDGAAKFTVRPNIGFTGTDFRSQFWWSFHNFKTDELTYDQFARTFDDVPDDQSENLVLHPFNFLWYRRR
jgi:hypothetical protein